MTNIPKKYLPALGIAAVGIAALFVRAALTLSFFDPQTGTFSGGAVLYGSAAALLFAALAVCAVFAARTDAKVKVLFTPARTAARTFVYSLAGFFMLFFAGLLIYAAFSEADFLTGSTKVSEFLTFIFTVGSAIFFFMKASDYDNRLSGSALYPLLYLFPVGFAATRLFMLFRAYSSHSVYMTEKLSVLSLVAICVYFLYEARFARTRRHAPKGWYCAVSAFALVLVPLSALPTLVFTLAYGIKTQIGEPVLCLVELSISAVMWMNYLAVAKEASDNAA